MSLGGLAFPVNGARRWGVVAILALVLFVVTFSFDASLIRGGLDNSWIFAINHFFANGIVVGAQEIFTYGPLGFVVYPQPIGRNMEIALAVQAGARICAAVALAAAYVVPAPPRTLGHAVSALAAALLLLGFCGAAPFGALRCSLIAAAVLVLVADRLDRPALFLAAAPFVALGLMTKPFYGVAGLTLFGASMLVRLARGERWWPPVTGAVATVALSLLAYAAIYSSVRGFDMYLRGILEMSTGYFTAMPSLGAVDTPWLLGLPISVAAAAWFCRQERRVVTGLALFAPMMYLGLRYGVAKQQGECVAVWTLASLLLILELPRFQLWPRLAPALLLGLYFFDVHANTGTAGRWKFDALDHIWRNTVLHGPRELREKLLRFTDYRDWLMRTSRSLLASEGSIEEPLRQRLLQRSVDSYPHELVWIAANGLSWRPRPVPQSYAANTPWLDGLDAKFLDGEGAPDLYLWETERDGAARLTGLDYRSILNDEPDAVLALFRRYRVTDWTAPGKGPFLVLERSSKALLGESQRIGNAEGRMGEWVIAPQPGPGILRARLGIRRTFFGLVARSLWYEPKTMVQYIVTGEGDERVEERRLTVDNAALGMWVSPFLSDLTGHSPPLTVRAFRVLPSVPSRFAAIYRVDWELTAVERVPAPDWRSALR